MPRKRRRHRNPALDLEPVIPRHRLSRGHLERVELKGGATVTRAKNRDPLMALELTEAQWSGAREFRRVFVHSGYDPLAVPVDGPGVRTARAHEPGSGPTAAEFIEACEYLQANGMIVESVTRKAVLDYLTVSEIARQFDKRGGRGMAWVRRCLICGLDTLDHWNRSGPIHLAAPSASE